MDWRSLPWTNHVRLKDCQPSFCCSVWFQQVELPQRSCHSNNRIRLLEQIWISNKRTDGNLSQIQYTGVIFMNAVGLTYLKTRAWLLSSAAWRYSRWTLWSQPHRKWTHEMAGFLKRLSGETKVITDYNYRFYEAVVQYLHDAGLYDCKVCTISAVIIAKNSAFCQKN